VPILRIHPEAREELAEAAGFYEGRVTGLGEDFLEEYRAVLKRILDGPERAPRILGEFRRLNLQRFPYSVVYRPRDEEVFIVAVAHMHRRPFYWKSRI
jgi:plasmid stabilization system protein ParE